MSHICSFEKVLKKYGIIQREIYHGGREFWKNQQLGIRHYRQRTSLIWTLSSISILKCFFEVKLICIFYWASILWSSKLLYLENPNIFLLHFIFLFKTPFFSWLFLLLEFDKFVLTILPIFPLGLLFSTLKFSRIVLIGCNLPFLINFLSLEIILT